MKAHLRVARPTNELDALLRLRREGLGFALAGGFDGRDGSDGVTIGLGLDFHFEFTRERGGVASRAP